MADLSEECAFSVGYALSATCGLDENASFGVTEAFTVTCGLDETPELTVHYGFIASGTKGRTFSF